MNTIASQINKQGKLTDQRIDTWVVGEEPNLQDTLEVPAYLEKVYWWAYVRPYAVAFFDREPIVNLILLGNMVKLRDAALDALGKTIHGRTLQIACVYGDFSIKLAQRIAEDGSLDVVDIGPAQLKNARRKLNLFSRVKVIQRNSDNLGFVDESYDQAILFFLLHEQPADVREKTLSEALRVVKPGGKIVLVDYHKPSWWNPLKYMFPFMFVLLEPFALDIWKNEIKDWLPKSFVPANITKETIFGGLYQKLVITK